MRPRARCLLVDRQAIDQLTARHPSTLVVVKVGRYGEMWGDMGRYLHLGGGQGRRALSSRDAVNGVSPPLLL